LPLQRTNAYRVDLYGRLIDLLLLVYGLAVFRLMTWARRINTRISRATGVAVLIVPAFALFLWQLPYRLMYQSAFERVDLMETRCYKLGESNGNLSLHCPDVAPPRNQVVSTSDSRLRPRGVVEYLLTPIAALPPIQ
jgi:hypothetical protein